MRQSGFKSGSEKIRRKRGYNVWIITPFLVQSCYVRVYNIAYRYKKGHMEPLMVEMGLYKAREGAWMMRLPQLKRGDLQADKNVNLINKMFNKKTVTSIRRR